MASEPVDHEHRAGLLWDVLTRAAQNRRPPLTYKEAATAIGIHHRPIAYPLGLIQDHCLEDGLPRLTALLVSASTGVQGRGFLGEPGNERDLEELYSQNWQAIPNPFSNLQQSELNRIADDLTINPHHADKYVSVLSRGNQQRVFSKAVLRAYGHQCAICEMSFPSTLQAAHIVPFGDPRHELRVDPRNGIALCANHHKLFDDGSIDISPEYRIAYYDPEGTDGPYSVADEALSLAFHGKPLLLPENPHLHPSRALLEERRAQQ
ncbi:HNH endonuclease [Ensifer adhaerens]|uniref:HNH endonuclease n=1 Tax=Ensifer adhaerens TaxID=106592 RepID=UPI000CF1136A|nr:HNH endonuclease [Ensifer adhaerens]